MNISVQTAAGDIIDIEVSEGETIVLAPDGLPIETIDAQGEEYELIGDDGFALGDASPPEGVTLACSGNLDGLFDGAFITNVFVSAGCGSPFGDPIDPGGLDPDDNDGDPDPTIGTFQPTG